MWVTLIILAQVFGPPQAGGQGDFDLCTGKTKGSREQSIAACHRVTFKEVLDKKSLGTAVGGELTGIVRHDAPIQRGNA